MEQLATVFDYEARYGEAEDPERLSVLLEDATAFVMAQPGVSLPGDSDACCSVMRANLTRVICAVVHRALSAGELAGLSSVSQGASGYTATVSVANPGEDFYLTKADRQALGIGVGRIGQTRPFACGGEP